MTVEVRNLLAAARSLSVQEQFELLQGLAQALSQQNQQSLTMANAAFWSHRSLNDIANDRAIPAIKDVQRLVMPDWPADESADDLIDYVKHQRSVDRKS